MIIGPDGGNYTEIKIKKLEINGKEQAGNVVPADATRNQRSIKIDIFTEEIKKEDNNGDTTITPSE
ncbi:MAG: hypothetical protein AB9856_05895 [Cellulosilyticaceae bacterium]